MNLSMHYLPDIVQKNEKNSIWNGAFQMIALSLVTSFIPLYAIQVFNASNFQIGIISSLPSLMSILVMIPGAIYLNRLETKKKFTAIHILLARFFFLFFIMVPFIPIMNQAWLLVILIALMNFPVALSTLSWQSLIGELIPDHKRGQFFSQRNRVLTIVGMLTTFTAGFILNQYEKSEPGPYQWLFLAGFIFGVLEVYYLMKHIEHKRILPNKTGQPDGSIRLRQKCISFLQGLIREKPYFYFVLCALLFNFGWQMAWPLFNLYQINYAQATALWISIFTVANQISQILSYRWWGRMADKWGNSAMLFVACLGMTTAPILTILSTNFIYLTIVNFFTGIFVAGTTMLLFNQLLRVSPEANRTSFIANYNLVIAFIGVISPQIGVFLLEQLGMNLAMGISSIFRFLGGISFFIVVFFVERSLRKQNPLNL